MKFRSEFDNLIPNQLKNRIKLAMAVFLLLVFGSGVKAQVFNYQLLPKELAADFAGGAKLIEQEQYDAGFSELDQALARMWTSQVLDLPAYSAGLIRLCDKLDPPETIRKKLLDYSFYFAPHSAEMAFARARFFFMPRHFSADSSWSEIQNGVGMLYYDLTTLLRIKARLWISLAEFFQVGLLIFSLILIFRYHRVSFHWFHHLFPANYQKLALPAILLLVLIPFFAGAPLWQVLVWPGILFLAFSPRPLRIIYLVFLLAFCFTGFFRQEGRNLIAPLTKGPLLSIYHLGFGLADNEDLQLLQSSLNKSTDEGGVLGLAEANRRIGDYKKSEELLQPLLSSPQAAASAYNELGCVYIDAGKYEDAIKALEKAAEANPEIRRGLLQPKPGL